MQSTSDTLPGRYLNSTCESVPEKYSARSVFVCYSPIADADGGVFVMAPFRFIFVMQYLHPSWEHMVFIMAREEIVALMR